MSPIFRIYTDGSANNNAKHAHYAIGAWAALIMQDGITGDLIITNGAAGVTSQAAELRAVIDVLEFVLEHNVKCRIYVYTDSAYIVNCFLQRWFLAWQRKNYFGVKNADLWRQLIPMVMRNDIAFVKVKGHADNKYNNRVDALAQQKRAQLIEELLG